PAAALAEPARPPGMRESAARRRTTILTTARRMRSRSLNEQLRGRARSDCDRAIVLAAQPHRIGGGVARLDLDRLARLQIVAFDEAEERGILIRDTRHSQRLADR